MLWLSFRAPIALSLPKQFSSGPWQSFSVKTYLTRCCRRNLTASMIKLVVMFRPSNILQKYILLTYYYQKLIEKLPAPCLVDANQSSKYFAFSQIIRAMIQDCSKENKECISSNSFGGILFIFMISRYYRLRSKIWQQKQQLEVHMMPISY